jgi:hypothetical protein
MLVLFSSGHDNKVEIPFMKSTICCSFFLLSGLPLLAEAPRQISGIYPNLAMFNNEGECGTGTVVPWADRLWVLTYAPHQPKGSSDKLYEITPDKQLIIRPESIGGTPANRMIHRESNQLFMGPYAIGADRTVRTMPYSKMFGRHTGTARSLTDPAGKVIYATMEEGIYEVDVKTLEATEIWADEQQKTGRHAELPGYHGKGFASGQGRYIYANNGDHAKDALTDPATPSGVLAEWDGKADKWTVVRRNQFTDVTGPGGIYGPVNADDPLWSIGWDHRSLILMLLDRGKWSAFRLPKASHCYDGAHGWNTEWPRIREIGEDSLLMTMHGSFWKFPKTFSASNTAGISPRSTYVKVVGDFARWGEQVVLGCDDAAKSEFLNKDVLKGNLAGPGQSQSNLWFVNPAQLDQFGPALGRGAVWVKEVVKANTPSDPFLFSGFSHRSLSLSHGGTEPLVVKFEVDAGKGEWKPLRSVTAPAQGATWVEFPAAETGSWIRLTSEKDSPKVTAFFHYRNADTRSSAAPAKFNGLATAKTPAANGGTLLAMGGGAKTLRFHAGDLGCYDLDGSLKLVKSTDPKATETMTKQAAIPASKLTVDAASVLYVDAKNRRWRLPKGDPAFDTAASDRVMREICTERNLLNAHGTFYEVPAENAGGIQKLRPIATHNRRIQDYVSYRGLLLLSGITADATGEHIIKSDDGKCALWAGTVDDLWELGKPRGQGGPWHDTAVKANVPSDAYLATGYDQKRLVITSSGSANVRIEADFNCGGDWTAVTTLDLAPGQRSEYTFPAAFGAYWLRVVSDTDSTMTATFIYE